jgi:hypothetical protein
MDVGILRYSPKLLGNKSSSKWWLVIDCDPDLGKYYRQLFHLMTYRCYKLQRPAWECHITVIRDEEPRNNELWEKYNGENVEYEIVPNLGTNGDYFWFPVKCPRAMDIRTELGLGEPEIPFHVSIGHGCY